MYDFVTGQLFLTILSLSLSGALTGIFIAVIRPITVKYFSKKWNYYIWLIVAVRLLIPFHSEINLLKPLNLQFHINENRGLTQADSQSCLSDSMAQSDNRTHPDNQSRPDYSITQPDTPAQPDNLAQVNGKKLADHTAQSDATPHGNGTAMSPHNDQKSALTQSPSTSANPASTGLFATPFFAFLGTTFFNTNFFVTHILKTAALIWLFGAFTTLLIKLLNYWHFQSRLKKDRTRITESNILIMENAFCARLHIAKAPALYESASIHSPMTIGLLKPAIILPKTVSDNNQTASSHIMALQSKSELHNPTKLQLILHHELVHVARKDLWYKWIFQLLLCVHWFNPVLHRISRQINSDCELSCDEAILPELTAYGKQLYGNILLDAAECEIICRQSTFSTTLLENKSNLKKRLDAIIHYKKAARFQVILSVCVFTMTLTLSACSAVWLAADELSTLSPERPDADALSDFGSGLHDIDELSDFRSGLPDADELSGLESGLHDTDELSDFRSGLPDADALSDFGSGLHDTDELSDFGIGLPDTTVLPALGPDWPDTDALSANELEYDDAFMKRMSSRISEDDDSYKFWKFYGAVTPDRTSDAWKVYDNDALLAGEDIHDFLGAYHYKSGFDQKLLANCFVLFGSDSFAIVYADQDTDVQITSAYEIVEGNFKVVYVAPDKRVVTLNDTGAKTTQTVTLKKGRNVFKIVGQGGKLTNLEIDYSGIHEQDFENVFYSQYEEYIYQVTNGLIPAEKDKVIDSLSYWDEEAASEIFRTFLDSKTPLTADELCLFLIYSDSALSSQYLLEALRNNTIGPFSADTVSSIMPFLEGDCCTEVLLTLPVEDFYDIFAENIYYLDDNQKEACLTDFIKRGGTLALSMYDRIAPYLDDSTKHKLDLPGDA